MTFDPTISWGAILNAFVLLAGFIAAFTRIGGLIGLMTLRLERLEKAVEKLADNNTRLALVEERVTNHSKMIATNHNIIEDLRHGKGFVSGPRSGVDGAY